MTQTIDTLHVSLPADLWEQLDHIAKSTARDRDGLVTEAIQNYLDLYRWQTAIISKRLERAESGQATFIPHDEVMAEMEALLNEPRQ